MNTKDYYKILGIERNAISEEIKKAYRKLVMKYHPDRVSDDKKKEAEEKFKEISEAYTILNDSKKRAIYDQYGREDIDPQFKHTTSSYADMFDFKFTNNFTTTNYFYRDHCYRYHKPKENIHYNLNITLEESAFGATKDLSFKFNNKIHNMSIKTPIGISDKDIIKLKRIDFDIIIHINIIKHPIFKKIKNDILCDVFIDMIDACLGAEIEVPTLYKKITIKIPSGTQPGTIFRIKDKGIMNPHTNKLGDELVKIKIKIPTNISAEEKELLLKFEGL